jgi:clan AA aspartic protease (TIGR02281 family)
MSDKRPPAIILWLSAVLAFLLGVPQTRAEDVQLKRLGGTYVVPVAVNGAIKLDFLMDTGASDVLLPADVVSTLLRTGTVAASDFTGRSTYTLADGSKLPSLQFTLRQLRVGNQIVSNVAASVAPAASQYPLLGQSFLSRLPPWTIDYRRHALVLNAPAPIAKAPPAQAAPGAGISTQAMPPIAGTNQNPFGNHGRWLGN